MRKILRVERRKDVRDYYYGEDKDEKNNNNINVGKCDFADKFYSDGSHNGRSGRLCAGDGSQ